MRKAAGGGPEERGGAGGTARGAAARAARATLSLLDAAIGSLAVLALVALVAIVTANAAGRYLVGTSLVWSLEAAQWLFVAIVLLGVPLAHRRRGHLAVTVLVDRLPDRARRLAAFAADVVVATVTLALLAGGLLLVERIGGTSPTLGLPQWAKFAPVPVSCAAALACLALRGLADGERPFAGPLAIALAAVAWFGFREPFAAGLSGADPVTAMVLAFLAALAIGTPVAFALLAAALVADAAGASLSPAAVVQTMVNGVGKFVLLAIPFFILAGALMNAGGLTRRLVDLASALVGHLRGGLAQVNVVSSALYAGVSGSSYADAALGTKLLVPEMVRRGYPAPFACAVTAAAATVPNVVPPSVALLILAAAADLSVGRLWVAGVVPGLLMAAMAMALVHVLAVRRGFGAGGGKASAATRLRAALAALPVLALAVAVVGGIRFGVVTPTEAGALAVLAAAAIGVLSRGALDPKGALAALRQAATDAALVGLLVAAASPFAFVLVAEGVPQAVASLAATLSDEKLLALLAANLVLLAAGMFLDIGAAILILAPILVPALAALGLDPIHVGVVIVMNLMVGGLTPPVGMLAFIAGTVSGTPVHAVFRELLPFVATLFAAVALVSAVPAIALGLGRILAGG